MPTDELDETRARIKELHRQGHGAPEIALIVNQTPALVWAALSDELPEENRAG